MQHGGEADPGAEMLRVGGPLERRHNGVSGARAPRYLRRGAAWISVRCRK
jgi:hypothetical protein